MAQTKRKRRTKHRGTAAGTIEARGRTGRKPTPTETRRDTSRERRIARLNRPPTLRSAATKAAVMAGLLFAFTQIGSQVHFFKPPITLTRALTLCVFALVLYIPLAYLTDRMMYNWRQRREAAQGQSRRAR